MKTELEAVNFILGVLNSSPVGDLETTLFPHVVAARKRVSDASTEVQKTAWWFNQEYHFEMTPDATTKEIAVPLNVMSVDIISRNAVVKRGSKLYDTYNHTYQFDEIITANQIVKLDFELLDEVVIDTIRYWAAAQAAELDLEDNIKAAKMEGYYTKSLAELRKADLKAQRRNALNSPTSARIVSGARYRGRQGNPNIPGGGF